MLVYKFMTEYHSVYFNTYQGEITFGDAIFYQRLTGGIPVQQSKEQALLETIERQKEEIDNLRLQNENYQAAISDQRLNQSTATFPQVRNLPQKELKVVDKTAVYRTYGVYALEEQLKKSQALDRQDPEWKNYQTDSPHTQKIRRLLLEAREAADRSMR